MSTSELIFTHKNLSKSLCDNDIHILQSGRNRWGASSYLWRREPHLYYFVVTKISSWSNKWAVFPTSLFKMVSILFSEPTVTFEVSKYDDDRKNT